MCITGAKPLILQTHFDIYTNRLERRGRRDQGPPWPVNTKLTGSDCSFTILNKTQSGSCCFMFLPFENWSVETSLTPILSHLITFTTHSSHSFYSSFQNFKSKLQKYNNCFSFFCKRHLVNYMWRLVGIVDVTCSYLVLIYFYFCPQIYNDHMWC